MFNPLYPFNNKLLQAAVKNGSMFFVRNTFVCSACLPQQYLKGCFIITHYNDKAKAEAHYNSSANDKYRFLYHWNDAEHQQKLLNAASNPKGYEIHSSCFMPKFENDIGKDIKNKISRFIQLQSNRKLKRNEKTTVDFYLQFGILYVRIAFAGQQISAKFMDIQNLE